MTRREDAAKIGDVPNQPKTPARAVRVDDELWDQVKAEAAARGEYNSDVVRRALAEHFAQASADTLGGEDEAVN